MCQNPGVVAAAFRRTRLAVGGVLLVVALLAAAGAARADASAPTMPLGFSDKVVMSGLSNPTKVRFSPDGRVFVAEKSGVLKVFDSLSDPTPTVVADLRSNVYDYGDDGLLGMALDPDFPASPYVYLLYTVDRNFSATTPATWNDDCPTPPGPTIDGCVVSGTLVRLELSGDSVASTKTLIGGWCEQYAGDSVGDLNFGSDGELYVSGGDGASSDFVDYGQAGGSLPGTPTPPNPCHDGAIQTSPQTLPNAQGGALRAQSLGWGPFAKDFRRAVYNGALLRVDPATGAHAPGNPPTPGTWLCCADGASIIAQGLRNPSRFAMRPGTNEVWLGDIGWTDWEEVDRLTDWSVSVSNFGWPCYEGNAPQPRFQAAGISTCTNMYSTGKTVAPYYAYSHTAAVSPGDGCAITNGSKISALSFYDGDTYPSQYKGALFFGDRERNCIWAMMPGADGVPSPSNIRLFAGGAGSPIDIESAPGGELFYVDSASGAIHELSYGTSSGGCSSDTFNAEYFNNTTLSGAPAFSRCEQSIDNDWGTGSPDSSVNADGFSARWTGRFTFPGGTTAFKATADEGVRMYLDGKLLIDKWTNAAATTYTATTEVRTGTHAVTVEYEDTSGSAVAKASWTTPVPNTPPSPVIDAPQSTLTYAVGTPIAFAGHASDAEDGTLPGSALSWKLIVHDCPTPKTCRTQDVQTVTGLKGTVSPPDHAYPSYLELQLTATDTHGTSTTTSVTLQPKTVALKFTSSPSGLTLTVGGSASTTPFTRTVVAGSSNSLSTSSPQWIGSARYTFSSWSDGGVSAHTITAPATDTTYDASFAQTPAPTCPCSLWSSSATPTTVADSGTSPWELGVRFQSDFPGYITGVRFYKGPGNTGTHKGSLWNAAGQRLALVTFTNETDTGWQQAQFQPPVAIKADTPYVVSYSDPAGHYSVDRSYFTKPVDSPPLHALADGLTGGNGLYWTSPGSFPSGSYLSSNYWVDAVFATDVPTDTTAPQSSVMFPTDSGAYDGAKWNAGCASAGAGFCGTASDDLQGVNRVDVSLRQDSSGAYWNGSSFSSTDEQFLGALGTSTWRFPFAAGSFPADGQYTMRVRAVDNVGNVEAASSRTFRISHTLPDAIIDAPQSTLTYAVGDPIAFSGHASDPVDGALPASALSWKLIAHRCPTPTTCDTRDVQTSTGVSSGIFTAPDDSYPSHLELQLTATDSGGDSATTSITLQPKTVDLSFTSSPSGLNLTLGGASATTPFTKTVIVGSANSVGAPSPQTIAGNAYTFSKWSDGGGATHSITAPATATTYDATFAGLAAPVTSFTTPSTGQTVSGTIDVAATADDPAGAGVWLTAFRIDSPDGPPLNMDYAAPYGFKLDTTTLADGQHTLFVRAENNNLKVGEDATVTFVVDNSAGSSVGPITRFTTPTAGQTVSGTIDVAATAADQAGTGVWLTAFRVDTADGPPLTMDYTAPYGFRLDTSTLANGQHTLFVRAEDHAQNIGKDAMVTFTVDNGSGSSGGGGSGGSVAPITSLTAPTAGQTVSGTIDVAATAQDQSGAGLWLTAFRLDTANGPPLNIDYTRPYGFRLDTTTLADGQHSLFVRAEDSALNVGEDATVTFVVDNASGSGSAGGGSGGSVGPVSKFTSPSDGQAVSGTVGVAATAYAQGGARMWFTVFRVDSPDSDPVAINYEGPWGFTLDTTKLTNGQHKLYMRGVDTAQNVGQDATVTFNVNN